MGSPVRRFLFFTAGSIALALGVLGILLPGLPTTPFLLLASYCFIRSSARAHRWLLTHPVFGVYIRDWEERRGVRRSVKVVAVCGVAAALIGTWWSARLPFAGQLMITLFAGIGLVVVWRLPVVESGPVGKPAAEPFPAVEQEAA